jgi:hypothetical protein
MSGRESNIEIARNNQDLPRPGSPFASQNTRKLIQKPRKTQIL